MREWALRLAGRGAARARVLAQSARDDMSNVQRGAEEVVPIDKWLELLDR